MSLTYPVRSNIGAASAATLAAPGIPNTAGAGSTFTVTGLTGFFDVATGSTPSSSSNIVVAVEYGNTNVEKILCTYAGGTFTIVSRNYDSTSTSVPTHVAGVSVIPVLSANEAAEHNAAVQTLKHVLTAGSSGTIANPGTIAIGSGTGSLGSATSAAHSDHSHNLPSTSLASWISSPGTVPGSSLTGAIASASTIGVSQLTGTALPSTVTIGASQLTGTALPSTVTIGASQLTGTALPTVVAIPVNQVTNAVLVSLGSPTLSTSYNVYQCAGSATVTLPATGFPVGAILYVANTGSSTVQFAQGSGANVISTGSTASTPKVASKGLATAIQLSAGYWIVGGQIS